jgi:uncharacterized membrane protein YozB (DUF420 family)
MAFDTIFVVVTISLLIQVAVLVLLLTGYWFLRRQMFRQHGIIMAAAVFVHLAAVFVIMFPSFVYAVFPEFIVVHPLELTSIVSIFHEVTGAIALGLGLWFVVAWRFRKNFAGCFGKRKAMLITLLIWVAALAFGVALYTIFNWNLMTAMG